MGNRWPIILSALLLSSACKMGPDYVRPETLQSESWRVAASTAESVANLAWWELLKDDVLQGLVRTTLEENLDLQVAAANIEQFQAQLMAARYDLIPSLNYSGTAFGLRNTNSNVLPIGGAAVPVPGQSNGLSLSSESVDIGLKWEVDLWGRIRRSIEAARAQLFSQQENQRAIIVTLVSTVAEEYFNLRGLDYEIEITRRTLNAWDETVRLSELRYKNGVIPKLDLERFRAERASTAAQLKDLDRQVVQTENRLSILMGHRPADIPRGAPLTQQTIPPAIPPGLPSQLLQRRPDILKAEQDLASSTANIGVAQAERFPQLALTSSVGGAGFQTNGTSVGPFAVFKGAASLTGPILNASALGLQVRSREAMARAAIAQYRKAVLTAFKEVEDALITVQKVGEQRRIQEEQVAALRSAYSLADDRYQGGRASYLDVLTAQRSLFDAELALARTRRGQLTAAVQLYKALGGGWSPGDADPILSSQAP